MTSAINWLPLSIIGAFLYGMFSFLLSFIDPKIKENESAQFGYGMILGITSGILALIMYFIWRYNNNKTAIMLEQKINWKIVALTLLFSIMITPMHTLVINKGGSVGQQTMYALAIIPVLVGSKYIYQEKLSKQQILGLVLAGIGAYFMSGKDVKNE